MQLKKTRFPPQSQLNGYAIHFIHEIQDLLLISQLFVFYNLHCLSESIYEHFHSVFKQSVNHIISLLVAPFGLEPNSQVLETHVITAIL